MAMALYSQCFNWIIGKINSRIRGREDFQSISILDIFGFENFQVRLGPGRRRQAQSAASPQRLLRRSTASSSSTSTTPTRSCRNTSTSTSSRWSSSSTTSRWGKEGGGGRQGVGVTLRLLHREGLLWVDIHWMDNGECLDLIEKVSRVPPARRPWDGV